MREGTCAALREGKCAAVREGKCAAVRAGKCAAVREANCATMREAKCAAMREAKCARGGGVGGEAKCAELYTSEQHSQIFQVFKPRYNIPRICLPRYDVGQKPARIRGTPR